MVIPFEYKNKQTKQQQKKKSVPKTIGSIIHVHISTTNIGNVPGRPQGGRHGMVFGQIPVSSTSVPLVPGSTPFFLILLFMFFNLQIDYLFTFIFNYGFSFV